MSSQRSDDSQHSSCSITYRRTYTWTPVPTDCGRSPPKIDKLLKKFSKKNGKMGQLENQNCFFTKFCDTETYLPSTDCDLTNSAGERNSDLSIEISPCPEKTTSDATVQSYHISREKRISNAVNALKGKKIVKAQMKIDDLAKQLKAIKLMRKKDNATSNRLNSGSRSSKKSRKLEDSSCSSKTSEKSTSASTWNTRCSWTKDAISKDESSVKSALPASLVPMMKAFDAIDKTEYREADEITKEVLSKLRKTADLLPHLVAMLPKNLPADSDSTLTSTDASAVLELIQNYIPKIEAKLDRGNHKDECLFCDDHGKCKK